MKLKIVSMLAASLIFLASCSKNDVQSEAPEKTSDVKVENGVLTFKTYNAFFSALAAQSNLTNQQRVKWEQEIGFTSMRTQYDRFNAEADQYFNAITKPDQYNKNEFLKIVERYKYALTETKDFGVYNLNTSGLIEAGLANEKGIVKVENDYIYFGKSQIVTFVGKSYSQVLGLTAGKTKFENGADKTIQVNSDPELEDPFALAGTTDTIPRISGRVMSIGNELSNISSVAIPNGQRWAVRNQAWNDGAIGGDGLGFGRIRLFAIQVPNNSIRGFVTLQMYASAINWLGIRRKIDLVGYSFHGQVDLIIQPQFAHNLISLTGNDDNNPSFSPGIEDFETVFLCSKRLKDDATILGTASGIPYANQGAMTNCPNVLNDDYMETGGQWWGNVFTNNAFTTLVTDPTKFNVIAIGKPPFAENYSGYVNLTNGNE